jgi:D-alanyl-D-alanine carboxypeptidase
MRTRRRQLWAFTLVVALAGCASTSSGTETATSVEPSASVEPSVAAVVSASPSAPSAAFRTETFASISEDAVPRRMAANLQAILDDMAGETGVSATVMTADGTWSGATGKADDARDMRVDDQFAIGSVTKSVVAAQVMQMIEAGELDLDDPAAEHLPPNVDFDTNGATIRQLLGMHSGIPDYVDALWESLSSDRQQVWAPADLLELVDGARSPAGVTFEYSSTNYALLGLMIEQVQGRPVADVLRDGVLGIDGTERLIYQPEETPTRPMAMPDGESTAALEKGGGSLPSLAGATAAGPAGGMASDSLSLARWWRAFCAGEIVSEASLTEMTTFDDGYGLGLYSPYPGAVGHTGEHVGYVSWAGCMPEDGVVVVVLSNHVFDIDLVAGSVVNAVIAG